MDPISLGILFILIVGAIKAVDAGAKVVGDDFRQQADRYRGQIAADRPAWSPARRERIAKARARGATIADLFHLGPAITRAMGRGWHEARDEWGTTREEHQAWLTDRRGELEARRAARGNARPRLARRIGDRAWRAVLGPVPQAAFTDPPTPTQNVAPIPTRPESRGPAGPDSADPTPVPAPDSPAPTPADPGPTPEPDSAPTPDPATPTPDPASLVRPGPFSPRTDYPYADAITELQRRRPKDPAEDDPAAPFWAPLRAQQREREWYAANGWRLLRGEGYSEEFLAARGIYRPSDQTPDPAPAGDETETAEHSADTINGGTDMANLTGETTSYEATNAALDGFADAASETLTAAENTGMPVVAQAAAAVAAAEQLSASLASLGMKDETLLADAKTIGGISADLRAKADEMNGNRLQVMELAMRLDAAAREAKDNHVRGQGRVGEAIRAADGTASDANAYFGVVR